MNRLVLFITAVALVCGCTEATSLLQAPQGSFEVHFKWAGAEPTFTSAVYLFGRVEERADPSQAGKVLSVAQSVEYRAGASLDFPTVENGANRVVVVELRDANSAAHRNP